jgi:hypothetical protein
MRGKGIKEILSGVHKIVKDNKLISKGLGMIPSPYAQVAAQGASLLGYGRKRRKRATSGKRTMRGRGFFNDLGSGVGNVFGGLGGGIGSIAHGLFGNGRSRPGGMVPFIGSGRKRKSVIKL